ncbi:hypothetical protein BDW72DRAFT_203981 [Aspergillus terricola var. indicus]
MSSESKKKQEPEDPALAPVSSILGTGEVQPHPATPHPATAHDDVFGRISEDGPNYRDVGWLGTVALMMKTQIGLGVLSIPSAFDTLGLIPGLICMLAIALNHREVYSIADTGGLMFGRIGKLFFGGAYVLCISIGLNALSTHGACTAIFVAVAAIIRFAFGSIRTLGKLGFTACIGLSCILTANRPDIPVFTITIAVGVQDRPSEAPHTPGPWTSDYKLIDNPSFTEGITAVSSLIFAYCGTPAFFAIVSEMRDPKYYTRSLMICQSGVTAIYTTTGTVVYYYCGSYVASPALGSAGPTVKKVAYGFALPGLIVTVMLVIHLPAKIIFIRLLRGSRHLTSNTRTHWITWLSCTFGITITAYIIASAIPVFNGLVSLIGALLGTLMSFQPMGCMRLYDNWTTGKGDKKVRWVLMVSWCVFIIGIGTFCMVAGTYGSIVGVVDSYKETGGSGAWSCVDNSGSV